MKRGVVEFSGKAHGLPGLGVGGRTGDVGEHGASSFIGPIQSFFDKVLSLEEGYVYLRRNQGTEELLEKFNGLTDRNNINQYYTGDDELDRLGIISLYKIEPVTHALSRDIQNDSVRPSGKAVIKMNGDNAEKPTDTSLNGIVFSDGESVFGEHVSISQTDEAGSYKFAKAWSDWRDKHDTNTYDTTEIGNLSSDYVPGDLLFVTDYFDYLQYIVPITESLIGKSYDVFSKNRFVPCDEILTNFVESDGRAVSRRGMVLLQFGLNDSVEEFREAFVENFINQNLDNFALTGTCNDDVSWTFSKMGNSAENVFPIWYGIVGEDGESEKGYHIGKGAYSGTSDHHMDIHNLFMKRCFTNVNIPEYGNSAMRLDGYRCPSLSEGDVLGQVISYSSIQFLGTAERGVYGFIIYEAGDSGWNGEIYRRTASQGERVTFDLTTDGVLTFEEGVEHGYWIVNFCQVPGSTVYYSLPSAITTLLSGNDRQVTIQYADGTTDTGSGLYDGISFMNYNLTPSESFTELRVECEDYNISDIYINGVVFVEKGELKNAVISEPSWCRVSADVSQESGEMDGETPSYFYLSRITFDDNIPDNSYSRDVSYVEDYMTALSEKGYGIGDKLADTVGRDVVVTCVVRDTDASTSSDVYYRSNHRIIQPGFRHPGDISIGITPLIKDGMLELSNDANNGILCNQLQYFLDLDIEGFTEETWGRYLEDPRLKLYITLSDNHYESRNSFDYLKTTTSGNIRLFTQSTDFEAFPNNGIRARFGWIPNMDASGNAIGVSYDSSLSDIEDNFLQVSDSSYTVYVNAKGYDDYICPIHDGWLNFADVTSADEEYYGDALKRLRSETFRKVYSTPIYYDFGDDGNGFVIDGISIASANLINRNRIRVMMEFGNPVPAEIDLNFKVVGMEVHGKVKDMYRNPDGGEAEELVFRKKFPVSADDIDNLDSDRFSGVRKFIINPIYMTVCDASYEASEGMSNIRTTRKFRDPDTGEEVEDEVIKITGSENPSYISFGLYGEDEIRDCSTRLYVSDPGMDNGKAYLLDGLTVHQRIEMGLPIYKNYIPLKRHLQDNVSKIYVRPRNLSEDISSGLVSLTDLGKYMDMFDSSTFSEQMKNVYNVYPIMTDGLNPKHQESYLSLFYNSAIMHPKQRGSDGETFYYNNTLYSSAEYAQKANSTPLLASEEVSLEVRSKELVESISAWNMEYEVSNSYNHDRVMGGILTKSGDGYNILPSDRDYGQYEDEGILSLADTKSLNSEPIFGDDAIRITEPSGMAISPAKGKYFRSLLWNVNWLYPDFMTSDANDIRVYPYYFCNSFEYRIDVEVTDYYRRQYLGEYKTRFDLLDGLWKVTDDGYDGIIPRLMAEGLRLDQRGISDYMEKKRKVSVSQGSTMEGAPINVVNSMIPYNSLYSIYPRTMVNTDAETETANVLMLMQPTVTSRTEYGLSKHYFKVSDNAKGDKEFNRLIGPWKFG